MTTLSHVTHPWYLSLGMDSNLIRDRWETFDFASLRLCTLAKGLSPAYLRLMGTDGDRMIFEDRDFPTSCPSQGEECPMEPMWTPGVWHHHYLPTNFTMFANDWDAINEFATSVGWRLLFGLNAQLRRHREWDPTNAIKLLKYSISKAYAFNLDFELGNEPELYPVNPNFTVVPAKQLAKDFNFLRNLLDTEFAAYYRTSLLFGPDLAMGQSTDYLSEFLSEVGDNVIRAVTFHQYYGGSELNHLDNYSDPTILDSYVSVVKSMVHTVRKSSHSSMPVWQGETSSTYASPGTVVCESYAAGFMLLDKLGLSASLGLDLVVRQTFYGFWFALVGQDLQPRPNYWTSLLFKSLVGTKVLAVDIKMTGNRPSRLRAYAHCAQRENTNSGIPQGAVVVYAMNLFKDDVSFAFAGELTGSPVDEYLLTPGDNQGLMSQQVRVNGHVVVMPDDVTLPELKPRRIMGGELKLPALSYAYYVLPYAKAEACM